MWNHKSILHILLERFNSVEFERFPAVPPDSSISKIPEPELQKTPEDGDTMPSLPLPAYGARKLVADTGVELNLFCSYFRVKIYLGKWFMRIQTENIASGKITMNNATLFQVHHALQWKARQCQTFYNTSIM